MRAEIRTFNCRARRSKSPPRHRTEPRPLLPPENPSRHWAGWRSNAGVPTLIVVFVYFGMRLYSAGIADEMRDFPLALLRPYSGTGVTPAEFQMKRGTSPSHYSARCWDGLLLRRNLQCYTDSSVRTTPADAGKGFYSVGFCNEIEEIPFAMLRSRLERACTPPDSAIEREQFRSHYSATCRDGLSLRRNL